MHSETIVWYENTSAFSLITCDDSCND